MFHQSDFLLNVCDHAVCLTFLNESDIIKSMVRYRYVNQLTKLFTLLEEK